MRLGSAAGSSAGNANSTWCSPRWRPGGTSCWRDRPAPARPPAAGDHRGVGHPAAVRRGQRGPDRRRRWSVTTTPPGCCARTTAPTTSSPGRWSRRCAKGGFLYIEEFNRAPEDTLNTLLTAIADRAIAIPRVGTVRAVPTFRVDRLDEPVRQRRHHPALHQRARPVVPAVDRLPGRSGRAGHRRRCAPRRRRPARRTADRRRASRSPGPPATHPDVRQGSSVRGAIDTVLVAEELCAAQGYRRRRTTDATGDTCFDAMIVALSGRIHLDEAAETTPEIVLRPDLGGPLHPRTGDAAEPG